jgi:2-methylcitrate dehydratase PrpD
MNSKSTPASSIATSLAAAICQFDLSPVSPGIISQGKICIADTIGVGLAGFDEPSVQLLLKLVQGRNGEGTSLIFGTNRRTTSLDATLINGVASHAVDFDDVSGVLGGHHSAPLVPLLFALGEEIRASGAEIIAAYIVGVEVETRLARAVHFHHYDKGWHPTATLGIFGAAAAASRLLKLDPARTAVALAIAASLASGIKANFGTMVKPLHVGQCGRNGLLAALLAQSGYDAAVDVFEHHQGFFNVFNGPNLFDSSRVLANWGAPWELADATIGIKQFPCCGSTHAAINAALNISKRAGFRPEDIASISILPHGRRLRHTNKAHPRTSLEAKFSVQYVVARALRDRGVKLKDFEGDAHLDPNIVELLKKTTASAHPDMADNSAKQWGAEVIVILGNGDRLSNRVENLVCRDGENPMTETELWEKFEDCASRRLPREQVAPLFEALQTLDKSDDINRVTALLRADPARASKSGKVTFARARDQDAPETTWVP